MIKKLLKKKQYNYKANNIRNAIIKQNRPIASDKANPKMA